MSKTIATIQTDDGDVYTGSVEREQSSPLDLLTGLLIPPVGMIMAAEALWPDERVSVKVNGQTYRGKVVR